MFISESRVTSFSDQTNLNLFWIKFDAFLKKKIYNFVTKVKPCLDNNQILISVFLMFRFLMKITKLNVRMVMITNVKSNGFV